MDGQTLYHWSSLDVFFFSFRRTRQQFIVEWGKVITLFSWVPAENANLRLSYENGLPRLPESRWRLRSGKSLATNLWCSASSPAPNASTVLPFLLLQDPHKSQLQFILQRWTRRCRRRQLQRARTSILLLICMQLHTPLFHTSWLTVTTLPTENE